MKSVAFSVKSSVLVAIALSLLVGWSANAAVSGISATINGGATATVATNSSVAVNVSVTKSGSGCENNWRSTVVRVDGNEVVEEVIGSITGTGVVSDSFSFTAPATPGDYTVLVEVMGGGESFGETVCNDAQVWGSVELALTVYEPVDPFVRVLSITPTDVTRTVGDTNPVVFGAEVAVGGVPTAAHLQCVIFDIFRGDNWNAVPVDFSEVGTYDNADGIFFSYDISGYATGTFDVIAVALTSPCDDLPNGFSTATYRNAESDQVKQTSLTITEAVPMCTDESASNYGSEGECVYEEPLFPVTGHKWNDVNGNGVWDENETGLANWTIVMTDEERELSTSTVTDTDGYYQFMVPMGLWKVSEVQQPNWRQTNAVQYPRYSEEDRATSTNCVIEVGYIKRVAFVSEDDDSDWNSEYEEYNRCDFGNQAVSTSDEDDGNTTSTRVGARESRGGTGQVLGAATSVNVCEGMFITAYMRMGEDNPTDQVYRLQIFLTVLGIETPLTGIFDAVTDASVRTFQSRYVDDVLAPWGLSDPTGYVYKTTRAKINNMVCPGSEPTPEI